MTTRCLKITGSWPVDQLAYSCWSKREHRLVYYSILSPVLVCLCQPMLWSYPLNSSPSKCLRNHQFVSALVFFCIHCSANRLCLHSLLIREMTGCPLPGKSVRGGHWCYIVMLLEVHSHALEDTRGQKHYLEHFHWEMVSFQHDPSYCIVAWIRSHGTVQAWSTMLICESYRAWRKGHSYSAWTTSRIFQTEIRSPKKF